MSKKIKDIAKKALDSVPKQVLGVDDWITTYNQQLAKFIIQECIEYINYRTVDWDADLQWIFKDGSGHMDVDIDSLLKQHFGIEE